MNNEKRWNITPRVMVAGLVVLLLLVDTVLRVAGPSKADTNEYLDECIVLATGTYATCRLINGTVSVIKEVSVSATPMGVGVEAKPGQILDSIDDAVERLSTLSALSLGFSGAQKIVYNIITVKTGWLLWGGALVFFLLMGFVPGSPVTKVLYRLLIGLLLLRLSVPLIALAGLWINVNYLESGFSENRESLTASVPAVEDEVSAGAVPEDRKGIISSIREKAEFAISALAEIKNNSIEILNELTQLFVLLLSKILLQVFILPLGGYLVLKRCYLALAGIDWRTCANKEAIGE